MRTDEDEERDINHHGRTITVEGGKRNNEEEVVRLKETFKKVFADVRWNNWPTSYRTCE